MGILSTKIASNILLDFCGSEWLLKFRVWLTSDNNRRLVIEIVYLVRICLRSAARLQLRVFIVFMSCRTAWLDRFKIWLFKISGCIRIGGYSGKSLLVLGRTLILRTSFLRSFCGSRWFLLYNLRFKLFQWILADNIRVDPSGRRFWFLIARVGTYCWWYLLTEDVDVCRRVIILQNRFMFIIGGFKLTYGRIVVNLTSFVADISHAVKLRGLIKVHERFLLFL